MDNRDREDREGREEREENRSTVGIAGSDIGETDTNAIRLPGRRHDSPLSVEAESVMRQTIGCAIAVHRALGPGFLESIYRKAMSIELESRKLNYERERPIYVKYRDIEIPGQRVDLIVEGLIVVELKSVVRLDEVHTAQVISYLRTTGLKGGLLINFRVRVLKDGLRRIVLTQ
jgi:GxxExxY protein